LRPAGLSGASIVPRRCARSLRCRSASDSIFKQLFLSFRGDAKHRAWNPSRRNNAGRNGFLTSRSRAPRNDENHSDTPLHFRYVFSFSRHGLPEFFQRHPRETEGAGKAGCAARTHSLACKNENTRVSPLQVLPYHPAFPARMVLTVYFALSPVTGLSCHRRLADTSAKLDASVGASGPHDFAVRSLAHSSRAPKASTASRTQRP
jgi:hypothetical protein